MTEPQVDNIQRALGRMEGKMDMLISAVAEREKVALIDSNRIDELEKWQNRQKAFVAGVSAVVCLLAGVFWKAMDTLARR